MSPDRRKLRDSILGGISDALNKAQATTDVRPEDFVQSAFEACCAGAGIEAAMAVGHGVPIAEIQQSYNWAFAAGLEAGIEHHEGVCQETDCGFRERVQAFVLLLREPAGSA